jgi:hypothetical protein
MGLSSREGGCQRDHAGQYTRREPVEKWAQVAIVIELGIIALAYLVGLFRRP